MNPNSVKAIIGKPTVIGLITLILGILLGVAAEKYAGRRSVSTRSTQAAYAAKSSVGKTVPGLPADPLDNNAFDSWDPFREMRDLRADMDEMFRRSIARFRVNPQVNFFNDDSGYSLSLDLRELKDRYEVRAHLPDAKTSETNVKLEGNRLEVEVTHRQTGNQPGRNATAAVAEYGRYTQAVELAGALKSDQMKVEHNNDELLITVPKA